MFTPRSRDAIRDSILGGLQTRAAAIGRRLLTSKRTLVYLLADALGVELEGLEAAAAAMVLEIFPDTASPDGVAHHGNVYGIDRLPAVAAQLRVAVAGPPSTSVAIPAGRRLTTAGGVTYAPTDTAVTLDGAGAGSVAILATLPGVAGTLAPGVTLTWSSAPTGLASTATVAEILTDGEDEEPIAFWAARIMARLRERPASGNRADWCAVALEVDGVGEAFVHPCTRPSPLTAGVLGCVTLLPVAPAPAADSYVQNPDGTLGAGLAPATSRRPSQALCDAVNGYIDGTRDRHGAVATRDEWYPATIDRADWGAVRAEPSTVDVTIELLTDGGVSDFAFDGARTVTSVTSASRMVLDSVASIAAGTRLAFALPTSTIRGGWALAQVATVNSGTLEITLDHPLPAAPALGAAVRADPGQWDAARAAVLRHFDGFGPGAPSGLGRSARFPAKSPTALADLIPTRLVVEMLKLANVIDADVPSPSTTQIAPLGRIILPGVITITRKLF